MLIYMMRHGQTDWNLEHRMQGATDIPLNETGRQMARTAAEGLKAFRLDRIYSSPLQRAAETAEIVAAPHALPVIYREDLREMCFGSFEGHNGREWPALRVIFDHPEDYIPDGGGETFQQVLDRCSGVLDELRTLEGSCDSVLLVAHGAVLKAMMFLISGKTDLKDFWNSPPQSNCSVAVIACENGTFRVVEYARSVDRY